MATVKEKRLKTIASHAAGNAASATAPVVPDYRPRMDIIEKIVDFASLNKQLKNNAAEFPSNLVNPALIKLLKDSVTTIDQGLKETYQRGNNVETIVYGRSRLIDQLIHTIYSHLFKDINQEIALVAVGGYGRGELHPRSDIDLMILLKEEENQKTKDLLEKFLMLLWDIRLEIGHSVRTIEECVDESTKDITVATNIMEARLLAGSEPLYATMKAKTSVDQLWDSKSFFKAKLEEQIQRNGKFNDTAYNLEPNLKESRGGLRDIQMIGWVAKRHFNANSLHDLVKEGFLLEDELKSLLAGQHLLWRIRCSLHYLAGRREDRLLFDYQRDLADEFGFKDKEINSIDEISIYCNESNEFLIKCDSKNYYGYNCSNSSSQYKITGLNHSGVIQQQDTTKPSFTKINIDNQDAKTNEIVMWNSTLTDNFELSNVWFSTNDSKQWFNYSSELINGTSFNINFNETINSSRGTSPI